MLLDDILTRRAFDIARDFIRDTIRFESGMGHLELAAIWSLLHYEMLNHVGYMKAPHPAFAEIRKEFKSCSDEVLPEVLQGIQKCVVPELAWEMAAIHLQECVADLLYMFGYYASWDFIRGDLFCVLKDKEDLWIRDYVGISSLFLFPECIESLFEHLRDWNKEDNKFQKEVEQWRERQLVSLRRRGS